MPSALQHFRIHTAATVPPARLTLNNREYLTAPAVLIVQGVMNGGYIDAAELHAHDWDAVPIVMGHPLDADNVPISARVPEVLAQMGVGHVYRASLGTGQRQAQAVTNLKAELWLDVAQMQAVGGDALHAMQMLENQAPLEISTAFYSYTEEVSGSFYGESYDAIHHAIRPDHVALLPYGVGACSWQDGCGSPRLHEHCACQKEGTMAHDDPRGWRGFIQVLKQFVQHEEAAEPVEDPTPKEPEDDDNETRETPAAPAQETPMPETSVVTQEERPTTLEEAIATLPTHLRESVGQMAREHDTRKQAAITALVAAKYPLSEARLTDLRLDELEQLVPLTIAQDPSYAGQGLPAVRTEADGEESWMPKSILARKE